MLPLGRAAGADRAVAAAHYQQLSARSLRSAQERCRGVREASVNTRINRASNSCSTSVGTCYAGKQGGSFIERSFTNSNPTGLLNSLYSFKLQLDLMVTLPKAMTESTEALASSSPLPPSKVDERGQSVSHHRPVRQPERQRWNSCSSVGRSTLLCGGRVVLGGHFLFSLGTLALLVVTLVLFVLSAMRNLGTYWLLSGIVLWTLSIIFLVQTAASDPGVIARDTSDVKPDPPLDFDVGPDGPSHRFCGTNLMHPPPLSWLGAERCADTCNIWRPPRAKHCRVCDNCVRRFDHHCVSTRFVCTRRCVRLWLTSASCRPGWERVLPRETIAPSLCSCSRPPF